MHRQTRLAAETPRGWCRPRRLPKTRVSGSRLFAPPAPRRSIEINRRAHRGCPRCQREIASSGAYALNNPARYRDPSGHAVWNCQSLSIVVSYSGFSGGIAAGLVIWICDGRDSYGGFYRTEAWSILAGLSIGKLPLSVTSSPIVVQDYENRPVNPSLLEGFTIYFSASAVLGFGFSFTHVGFGVQFLPGQLPSDVESRSVTSGSTELNASSLLTTGFDLGFTLMAGHTIAF